MPEPVEEHQQDYRKSDCGSGEQPLSMVKPPCVYRLIENVERPPMIQEVRGAIRLLVALPRHRECCPSKVARRGARFATTGIFVSTFTEVAASCTSSGRPTRKDAHGEQEPSPKQSPFHGAAHRIG
jgi:hypothetical protein